MSVTARTRRTVSPPYALTLPLCAATRISADAGVTIMTTIFACIFHWSRKNQIADEASRLLQEHGGRALFRALEGELAARRRHDGPEADHWRAVHDEVCRRMKRDAIIATIVARRDGEVRRLPRCHDEPPISPWWRR